MEKITIPYLLEIEDDSNDNKRKKHRKHQKDRKHQSGMVDQSDVVIEWEMGYQQKAL